MKGLLSKPMMKFLRDVNSFFTSMKTAIVLLVVIAALASLSTLVPQGRDAAYYTQHYGPLLSQLILSLGFDSFFRTPLFLIPVALFFVNLAMCSLRRMIRRLHAGLPNRFGPDLIHLGILLLIAGGIISLISRRETYLTLSAGEIAELPRGQQLLLNSFTYATYADGRPKDYVSSVEIREDGRPVDSADIRVNRPLKIENQKVYQDSFSRTATVLLRDELGRSVRLTPGEGFRLGDRFYFFMGLEPGSAPGQDIGGADARELLLSRSLLLFAELDRDGVPVERHTLSVTENLASFTVEHIESTDQTILRVVQDRGFTAVAIAFCIIGSGLALTFVQKLGELNP
jgi:cytochrome c biogenesis protein